MTVSSASIPGQLPTIRVFHNLARCGGTLISRCIASMQNVCLLSEIHPQGRSNRHFSAIRQYQNWYHDLGVEDWRAAPFDQSIDQIYSDCETRGYYLVLRDWAHIDFIGPPSIKPPGFKLALNERLKNRYQISACALVRHPAETWRSMQKMRVITNNGISVEKFLHGYRRYLEELGDVMIIRYEDFTAEPVTVLEQLSTQLLLPFDRTFIDRWNDYVNVTGDMHSHSRASDKKDILNFEIAELDPALRDVYLKSSDYRYIVEKLGYPF